MSAQSVPTATYNFFLDPARLGQNPLPSPPVETAPPESELSPEVINGNYKKLREKQGRELETLLGKLLKENAKLLRENEEVRHELATYRSSTREQVRLYLDCGDARISYNLPGLGARKTSQGAGCARSGEGALSQVRTTTSPPDNADSRWRTRTHSEHVSWILD